MIIMAEIQDTDLFLVNRNNTSYQVEAQNLMATIQENDLMLVNRGGSSYKITGAEVINAFLPYPIKKPTITSPVANSTGLTNSIPVMADYGDAGDSAIHYDTDVEVALDTDTDFASPVYYLSNITTPRAVGITLEPEKTFRVRMRFNTDKDKGEWSEPVTFSTGKAFRHQAGEPFRGTQLMFHNAQGRYSSGDLDVYYNGITHYPVVPTDWDPSERWVAFHSLNPSNATSIAISDHDKIYTTSYGNKDVYGPMSSAGASGMWTLRQENVEGMPEYWATNLVQYTRISNAKHYILLNNGDLYYNDHTTNYSNKTYTLIDTNVVKMSHSGGAMDNGAKGILYMKWVDAQNTYRLYIHQIGASNTSSQGSSGSDYINGSVITSGTQLTPEDGNGNEIDDIIDFDASLIPSQVYNVCYFVQRASDNIVYSYGLWHGVNQSVWNTYTIDNPYKITLPHTKEDVIARQITRELPPGSSIGGAAQTWTFNWVLKDFKVYLNTNTIASFTAGMPTTFSGSNFRPYSASASTSYDAYDPVYSTNGLLWRNGYTAGTKVYIGRKPKIKDVSVAYNGSIFYSTAPYGNGNRDAWGTPCFDLITSDKDVGTKVLWYQ